MLRSVVLIILQLAIGLTICAAFHTQVTSYDGIPNNSDFDISPFVKVGDKYYVIETTEKLNWFASAHQCRTKGAHLASIESKEEMQALADHLLAKYPDEKWFWLSGNDLSEENQYQWLSTGRSMPMEKTYWGGNQPDNYLNNEDCVQFRCHDNGLYKFNDVCCNDKMNYICEAEQPKAISIAIW